jgi:hypothetical protein
MKRNLKGYLQSSLAVALFSSLFTWGCGPGKDGGSDKIKLALDPGKSISLKMTYDFTVNAITTNQTTHFLMELSGTAETHSPENIEMNLLNNTIAMDGVIGGRQMKFMAGTNDSVPNDVAMVLTPFFSLNNKKFTSVYDYRLNKVSEMMQKDGSADSTENKVQFFLRYPDSTVKVGDSWQKELEIKTNNKMNCSAKYTLTEVKDGKGTITIEGKLTGSGESFGHEFSMDGTLKGTFTVDLKTGIPLMTDITEDFILDLSGQKVQMKDLIKHKIEIGG